MTTARPTETETSALAHLRELGLAGQPEQRPEFPHCSCGCREAHKVARRETFDGKRVELWSDGSITQQGVYLRGLGTPRYRWAQAWRIRAVRLIADDVGLYTAAELPAVVKIAERTFAHSYSTEDARRSHVRAIAARKIGGAS